MTAQEQDLLIDFVKSSRTYSVYLPLITFLLGTGVRAGEVIGLTWKDVDLKQRIIDINHQLIYKLKDGRCQFYAEDPKTDSGKRKIPMLEDVRKQLLKQKGRQIMLGIRRDFEVDGYKDFVFTTRDGKPIQPNCLDKVLINIVKAQNKQEMEQAKTERREPVLLPHFTCHNLRHTFCTRFCENESNIKVIQEIMGHSDISVTMNVYGHVK